MGAEQKILIVDDLVDNRFLLSQFLELLDWPYELAVNGKEAIDKLMEEPFALVFMDIEMPVMNGLETALKIRNEFPYPENKMPLIAITAHVGSEFEERIRRVGFDSFLSKPYSIDKIEATLKQWL